MWKLKAHYMAICAVYFLAGVVESAELETFNKEFMGPFNETYYDVFAVTSSASISNSGLQLTPDSVNQLGGMTHTSGRILLRRPFKLWEDVDDANSTQPHVASFNISFLFNIYRPVNGSVAEGLAFVIAPDLLVPPHSFGQFLGLTNAFTDSSIHNKLVAVEFDASKEFFDPDDNHIGININSIISIKNVTLTPP